MPSGDTPDPQQLLTALSTEHFTLQGARSQTMSESGARASVYVFAVSSALVALGFIGQVSDIGDVFNVFALTVLPTLYLLGAVTYVRLVECGAEDFRYGLAINRIRHYYKEIAGRRADLFLLSAHDDGIGVFANMALPAEGRKPYFAFSSAILVINSVVGGVAVAVGLGAVADASLGVAAGAGAAVAIASIAAWIRYADRLLEANAAAVEPLYPTPRVGGALDTDPAVRCRSEPVPFVLWVKPRKGRKMETEHRTQKIAVTGATGRVGSHLVEVLKQRGHDVVPISRSNGVDVVTGAGLDEALLGAETIIDTATGPSPDQEEATAFFTASARNLQRAGAAAGAQRIVVVSIIGIDKFQGGYNAAKVAQEQTLLEGPLPIRILRAAQFHEFVEPLVGWTIQDGVAHVPEFRTQLVAALEVAEALADAAEEPEIENGRITEVAGPREERLADAAAALFANRGESVEIRESRNGPLADPDDPDAVAYAQGAALPNPGAKLAGPSFREWLAANDRA